VSSTILDEPLFRSLHRSAALPSGSCRGEPPTFRKVAHQAARVYPQETPKRSASAHILRRSATVVPEGGTITKYLILGHFVGFPQVDAGDV
jgi:hypothetical protein